MAVTIDQLISGGTCIDCGGSGIEVDPENPFGTITCALCSGTGYGSGTIVAPLGLRKVSSVLATRADFLLDIARGLVPGMSHINKFGRNPDIDPGSDPEDIWDGSNLHTQPTTERIHDLTSTSANDTSDGTGARAVKVYGLGRSYTEQSEIVATNGIEIASTVNDYIRIFRAEVASAGSGLVNAGTILATAQIDATVTAQINPTMGKTLMAIYTVPAGKTAYMAQVYATLNKSSVDTAVADMLLRSRGPIDVATSAWQTRHIWAVSLAGSSDVPHEFIPYKVFAEKTDILVKCLVTQINSDISAGFDLILVDN